jgi:hypothetical protein
MSEEYETPAILRRAQIANAEPASMTPSFSWSGMRNFAYGNPLNSQYKDKELPTDTTVQPIERLTIVPGNYSLMVN